jgi:hypothetical protein
MNAKDGGVVLRWQLRPGREGLLLKENREDSPGLLQRRVAQLV